MSLFQEKYRKGGYLMARSFVKVPEVLPAPEERRRLREAAGISGAELAAQIGVSPGSVYAWETTNRKPRGLLLDAYGMALRVLSEAAGNQAGEEWPTDS
jgi:DNA-binding XRE family transcriptional regulator